MACWCLKLYIRVLGRTDEAMQCFMSLLQLTAQHGINIGARFDTLMYTGSNINE
jgi:hypothetical protein